MTAVQEVDGARWRAHAQINKFNAQAERDTRHILFPKRARFMEEVAKRGQLHRVPSVLLPPHIDKRMMESVNFDPFETTDHPGNLLVTAGLTRLMLLLINSGATQAYDATHTAIGVGDTSTAAAIGNTDLAAAVNAANRYVQVADSTFPSVALGVMTVTSTFATGNGNFAWAEWAIGGNTASGANAMTAPLLNRKVTALGTKTSAAAWAFTVTVTIA